MNSNGFIEVLWIDDEHEKQESFKTYCRKKQIEIVGYKYTDEGLKALEKEPHRWDLVLLDIQGQENQAEGLDDAGFMYARGRIKDIGYSNNITIPYLVFSGQDCIYEDRFRKVCREDKLYSKGTDTQRLVDDIQKIVGAKKDVVIKELYKSVFNAIEYLGLGKENEDFMVGLLKAIHYREDRSLCNRRRFGELRIIMEDLFVALSKDQIGLIPMECYKPNRKEINAEDAIRYLQGEQTKYRFGKSVGSGIKDSKEAIFPHLLGQNLYKIYVYAVAVSEHRLRDISEDLKMEHDKCLAYFDSVGRDNLMAFSLVLQLCDILTYAEAYVKSHPDPEENRKRAI